MPVISRAKGYLFIATPRTGSTAIIRVLQDHYDGETIPSQNVEADGRVLVDSKHGRLGQLLTHGILTPKESERLFKFCGVRNPFDSIVSLYEKTRRRYVRQLDNPAHFIHRSSRQLRAATAAKEGFGPWLDAMFGDDLDKPAAHLEAALNDDLDFVIRFEHLQADFDAVMEKLGLGTQAVPQVNPTPGRTHDYRSYYDERSRAVVERRFALDLCAFGYEF